MERFTKKSDLFTGSLIPHGNNKLLDFDDTEKGISYRYAQFNTRALKDCPFRSAGCERVCYATKGNHQFPSVKESREKAYQESRQDNFSDKMIYSIRYHLNTRRYKGNTMIIRIHESGDFYSVQYLRKWVKIWQAMESSENVTFVFYTKSFPFFLMLAEEEKNIIRRMMENGKLSINLSIDDTTSAEQRIAYLNMIKEYPLSNSYIVTEKTDSIPEKDICNCENCAKCGACNTASGGRKVVAIHSASNADKEEYRKNIRRA